MPTSLAGKLVAADVALDRTIDVLGEEFADTATRQSARWFRVAAEFIGDLPATQNGRLSMRGASRAERVRTALEDATWHQTIGRALDRFADVSTAAFEARRLAGQSTTLTREATGALAAYRRVKLAELNELRDGILGRVAAAIRKAAVAGQDVSELFVEVGEILGEWPWRARTLYETGLAEFSQVVTAVLSGPAPTRAYLYTGPVDNRIRPFCLRLVGRVLTRASIDRLDNGQLPNSFLTRGGYNCRHQWRDVTEIPSLAKFADTTGVVADVYTAVARLEAGPRLRSRRST